MLTGIAVIPVAVVFLVVLWAFVLIGSGHFGSTE